MDERLALLLAWKEDLVMSGVSYQLHSLFSREVRWDLGVV